MGVIVHYLGKIGKEAVVAILKFSLRHIPSSTAKNLCQDHRRNKPRTNRRHRLSSKALSV
jgi:hypothetical protein